MKLKVRSSENSEVLMKIIKNPITNHLPNNCNIITTCEKSRLVDLDDYVKTKDIKKPIVFVVGAISQGDVEVNYSNDSIGVSSYALSASVVCSKICNSMEKAWEIL